MTPKTYRLSEATTYQPAVPPSTRRRGIIVPRTLSPHRRPGTRLDRCCPLCRRISPFKRSGDASYGGTMAAGPVFTRYPVGPSTHARTRGRMCLAATNRITVTARHVCMYTSRAFYSWLHSSSMSLQIGRAGSLAMGPCLFEKMDPGTWRTTHLAGGHCVRPPWLDIALAPLDPP